METICLFVIATAGYTAFAQKLIPSARKHLTPGYDRHFLVLTDSPSQLLATGVEGDVTCRPVTHLPWPAMTLRRYHILLANADFLCKFDHVYYCDADCLFQNDVDLAELGRLTAVIHAGYKGRHRRALPYEKRPASAACIGPHEGGVYFCGGFQGGMTASYLAAATQMAVAIDKDQSQGITAIWHDESHWNRYLIDNPPSTVLSPLFCWPEQCLPHDDARILALVKNHHEVRNAV